MDQRATDFGVLLAIANATFFDGLDGHMARAGFPGWTPRQGAVLRVLGREAMSLAQLAAQLQMTSPGALKLVALMSEAGLVERVAAPTDRRVRLVRVSDRGRAALAAAGAYHAGFERGLADRLGPEVVRAARSVLEDVADHAPVEVPSLLRAAAATTTPAPPR